MSRLRPRPLLLASLIVCLGATTLSPSSQAATRAAAPAPTGVAGPAEGPTVQRAGAEAGRAAAFDDGGDPSLRPGVLIVETIHGERPAGDPRVAPFIANAAERVAQVSAERRELFNGTAARAGSGLSVVFVSDTPAEVEAIVNQAVAIWNDALLTTPGGPVVMTFNWASFGGDTSLLGFAGPSAFRAEGSSFIPVALSNTIDGADRYPVGPELTVTLSSDLYQRPTDGWYVGNGDVPPGKIDLLSTVLHEIGHGLGFLGSARIPAGGSQPALESPPDTFDTLALFGTTPLLSLPDPASQLTSGNIWIDIGAGRRHQLHAPTRFQNGSSYSHFDETRYPTGQPGSLMTPALDSQEIERTLDAATLGVMAQIGWPMQVGPVQPKNLEVRINSDQGTLRVDWITDLFESGTPPLSYQIDVVQGASVIRTVQVNGTVETTTFTGLVKNTNYTLRVTPLGRRGAGTPAEQQVLLSQRPDAPLRVNVVGTGLNRTVLWEPPDNNGKAITSYTVSISTDGGPFTVLGQTTGTGLATGDLPVGVHQFRVTATNADGTGEAGASLPVGFGESFVRPVPIDGQIARLYQAYFRRGPDASGFAFFTGERANGSSLTTVSDTFAASPEFVNTYGALDDTAFVELVYQNVLGRAPDAEGLAFWVNQLASGITRGELMAGFSESPEFANRSGIVGFQTAEEGLVERIYFAFFLRPPDDAGRAFWLAQIQSGLGSVDLAELFVESAEFQTRYGALDNEAFVDLVYNNVLTRMPDGEGQRFWVGQLNNGLRRGAMMAAFANSPEFILRSGTAT